MVTQSQSCSPLRPGWSSTDDSGVLNSSASQRPLRVLVVGINWPPETFVQRLVIGLAEAGVAVTVATAQAPDHPALAWLPTPAWAGPPPLRLARLGAMLIQARHAHRDLASFARHLAARPGLQRQLNGWWQLLPFAGQRWDVIYFPWNSAAISMLPLFDLDMPVVVSCRGSQVSTAPLNPERAAHKAGLTRTFQRATAVHCVSTAIVADAQRYGLDPAKACVIRPSIDPDFFYPLAQRRSVTDAQLNLITTGNLIWLKGYEYLLLALWRLRSKGIDAALTIIGDGSEIQRLRYTIHDLALEPHVRLLGKLAPEQVRAQLWHADVFVLTSLSEGIANVVLEAMACGLPVVTSDCGGMREAVDDGVEGFVTPVRDPEATAAALARLAVDEALRRRMGEAGRVRVLREFTLALQVQAFSDLFYRVNNVKNSACASS
jgi:colanic acid/amylovoran biosynthesis glycosyltransferase